MNTDDLQIEELRRFAELGRLSATMIHEISNPLSAAMLQLELSDKNSPEVRKARRSMEAMRRYVEAARHQISSSSQVKICSLQPQFDQIKRILVPLARQAQIKLEFSSIPVGCKLLCDPVKFQQIIANLIMNAIQAYDSQSEDDFPAVKVTVFSDDSWLVVQVQDWGKGIAPSEMPKLFEPFYTTKSQNDRGLGLGLAVVKQYVADLGGSIKVKSSARIGTQFIIKLRRYHA